MSLEGQTLGEFEILALLGQGGMGAVYKARQVSLDRIVALKTLQSAVATNQDFIARFRRESKAAAGLNHPNLVQMYSAGETDGLHWFAMELIEGETLGARLKRTIIVEPDEALAITAQVAEALKYAWNKARLVHRDIKPDNIFLSTGGNVKLGDLGLAKSADNQSLAGLTQTGVAIGTPHYASPEQAKGLSGTDYRSDIYSLGCTLYHMLAGRTPYEGDSSVSILVKQINDAPPAMLKVWPQCPMPLVRLVGKMLRKNPAERHQSYDELIADILRLPDKLRHPAAPESVAAMPAGVVTMMFTDIVGSTQLKSQMQGATVAERDAEYARIVKNPHDELVRAQLQESGGHVVKSTGDGFFAAFADAEAAVLCALRIQGELASRCIQTPAGTLHARIGLHTGSASAADGDYSASTADKAARIAAKATGGNVLISRQTHVLVEQLRGVAFLQGAPVEMKGFAGKERLFTVTRPPHSADAAGTPHPPSAVGAATTARKLAVPLAVAAAVILGLGAFFGFGKKEPQLTEAERANTAKSNGEVLGTVTDGTSAQDAFGVTVNGNDGSMVPIKSLEMLDIDASGGASATPGRPAAATKGKPFVNTLGMKFVPVPIVSGPSAGQRVLFGVWDVRVQDYAAYAGANPKVDDAWTKQHRDGVPGGRELNHPVMGVSWEEAQAFCQWLTEKETAEGKLPKSVKYRLPSDEEWSWAVGLPPELGGTPAEKSGKNTVDFPWGKDYPPTKKVGNYADETFHGKFPKDTKDKEKDQPWLKGYNDDYVTTSPVGRFPANAYGLYDMGGNVWRWCEDSWNAEHEDRVVRGGSWNNSSREHLLSSCRFYYTHGGHNGTVGFRCVVGESAR